MRVIGEAARREALASRREGGDAGHVPGCARDHALIEACVTTPPEDDALHYCPRGPLTACGKRREAVNYTDGAGGTRYMDASLNPCTTCQAAMGAAVADACAHTPDAARLPRRVLETLRDVATGKVVHAYAGSCPNVGGEGPDTEWDRADIGDDCAPCDALRVVSAVLRDRPEQAHEIALRRVEDARAALPEMLRRGYALDEGQVATVLRVADALAAGMSLEAREVLGRELVALLSVAFGWQPGRWSDKMPALAERLFAIGRASVVPPDADLARVIAAWPMVDLGGRARVVSRVETEARAGWRLKVTDLFHGQWVAVAFADPPAATVVGCVIDGEPATPEQWAKLRAAGVPVAEGVGLP